MMLAVIGWPRRILTWAVDPATSAIRAREEGGAAVAGTRLRVRAWTSMTSRGSISRAATITTTLPATAFDATLPRMNTPTKAMRARMNPTAKSGARLLTRAGASVRGSELITDARAPPPEPPLRPPAARRARADSGRHGIQALPGIRDAYPRRRTGHWRARSGRCRAARAGHRRSRRSRRFESACGRRLDAEPGGARGRQRG